MAHALHPHRLAGQLGQQRGVQRGIAGVVAAIGAGTDQPDALHLVRRQSEQLGHAVAGVMGLLRAGPQRGAIGLRIDNRAGRAHAGMRLERPFVLGLDHPRGTPEGRRDVALGWQILVRDGGRRTDVVVNLLRRRKGILRRGPLHLERLRGAHRVPLTLRNHGQEVLLMHHARALDGGDRLQIDGLRDAAGVRRANHAGVKHAGDGDIGHELLGAKHLARHVAPRHRLAHDLVFRGRLGLGLALDIHLVAGLLVPLDLGVEGLAADQLGVTDALGGIVERGDHAIADAQPFRGQTELCGGHAEQDAARLGRGVAQRLGAGLDAQGTRRTALVQRGRGVARDHADLVDRDVEFIGHDLGDGDFQALAQVDLAVEGADAAIARDRDPRIELLRHQRRSGRGASLRQRRSTDPRHRGANHQRARGLEKFAAAVG